MEDTDGNDITETISNQPNGSKIGTTIIVIFIIVILIVGLGIGGYFLYKSLSNKKNNVTKPSSIDCKVSDWTYGECDCARKKKQMIRTVITPANGGKECPPLSEYVSCVPDQNKCMSVQFCQPAYLGNAKAYKKYTCADRMSSGNNETCDVLCQKDPKCVGAFTTRTSDCYECSLIDKDNISLLYDNMNKQNPDGEQGIFLSIYKPRAGEKFKELDKCRITDDNISLLSV